MQVHYQLATLKKGGSTIVEYFQKFKGLTDTLTTADNHSMTLSWFHFCLLAWDLNMIYL